jgi:hypothetical protein
MFLVEKTHKKSTRCKEETNEKQSCEKSELSLSFALFPKSGTAEGL